MVCALAPTSAFLAEKLGARLLTLTEGSPLLGAMRTHRGVLREAAVALAEVPLTAASHPTGSIQPAVQSGSGDVCTTPSL